MTRRRRPRRDHHPAQDRAPDPARRPAALVVAGLAPVALLGAVTCVSVTACGASSSAAPGLVGECESESPDDRWAPPSDAASDPDWSLLMDGPLYSIPLPDLDGCPAPATAATMSGFEESARAQLDCVQAAWRPVLEALGLDAAEVPVRFYRGDSADTPCGVITCPAVYCAADGGGIWIGEASLDSATWFVLGIKGVVNHEYAHHLQSAAGILDAQAGIGASAETTRRVELQATCLAYAMIAHDESVAGQLDLYASSDPLLGSLVEDHEHGSRDSVSAWAAAGLEADTIGDCNTWVAAPDDVS